MTRTTTTAAVAMVAATRAARRQWTCALIVLIPSWLVWFMLQTQPIPNNFNHEMTLTLDAAPGL